MTTRIAHGEALCEDRYVISGFPCPYRAKYIIAPRMGDPFRVCGYHKRGYIPSATYPIDWSLARIKAWQRASLVAS